MNTLQSNNQDTSKNAVSARYVTACRGGRSLGRRGFTLIEILVALAIFTLLMGIILVPINMGMDMLHIGKAQSDVRSATQSVVTQMRHDLSRAIYVYPNDVLASVTGTPEQPKLPYGDPADIINPGDAVPVLPYFVGDPCDNNRVNNLSRIDMLLPNTQNGALLTPVLPAYYVVTYYARRLDPTQEYQPIDNPIVLFRAQIPFRGQEANRTLFYMIDSSGGLVPTAGSDVYPPPVIANPSVPFNANVYSTRYTNMDACTTDASSINRSAEWLVQDLQGEPNLEALTSSSGKISTLYGSHSALLPAGVGLATGVSYNASEPSYVPPKSTFICADSNSDGIIDQVTVSLVLEKVDSMGAQPKGQQVGLPQTIALPNVRKLENIR